jgi:alkanesulfonate monooxygenase SsuD/methylene tetrahydromethanopterin reductase-like flavin-dependent oxidoreductase (luciferase family)
MFDHLSNGRFIMGVGPGGLLSDFELFGTMDKDRNEMMMEAIDQILELWGTEPPYHIKGKHWTIDMKEWTHHDIMLGYVPKPLQQPHPPLWVACSQMETIRMAGTRGMGALAFQFLDSNSAQAWVHAYYNAFTKTQDLLTTHATNPNIAIVAGFMCAPTDEEAARLADGWTFFQFCLAFYGKHGPVAPGSISLWKEYETWRASAAGKDAGGVSLIGSPATLRRRLEEFEASHIDQIILLNQAGKTTHQAICDSLELFAQEVMPEFQARDTRHQAWKRDVLEGRLELAEIDTRPYMKRAIADPGQKKQNIL